MTGEAKVTVDTTEAQRELAQLKETADFTAMTVMSTVRKSYQTLRLLGSIFSYVIPLWFDIMATAAIMAGEMFAELAAAETMSGWLAAKAGFTFSISLLMFYRGMQIQQQKTQIEQQLAEAFMLGNIWF